MLTMMWCTLEAITILMFFYGALGFLLGIGYHGQTMFIINFGSSTNGYQTLLVECKYLLKCKFVLQFPNLMSSYINYILTIVIHLFNFSLAVMLKDFRGGY